MQTEQVLVSFTESNWKQVYEEQRQQDRDGLIQVAEASLLLMGLAEDMGIPQLLPNGSMGIKRELCLAESAINGSIGLSLWVQPFRHASPLQSFFEEVCPYVSFGHGFAATIRQHWLRIVRSGTATRTITRTIRQADCRYGPTGPQIDCRGATELASPGEPT